MARRIVIEPHRSLDDYAAVAPLRYAVEELRIEAERLVPALEGRIGGRKVPMWIHREGWATLCLRWDLGALERRGRGARELRDPHHELKCADAAHPRPHASDPEPRGARALARSRANPGELRSLLRPCADGEVTAHPVSTLVNSPVNDRPECIEPANE